MKLRPEEIDRRYAEFPKPVRVLANQSATVKIIMERYAGGTIITFQEALCQMVAELAIDNQQRKNQIMDLERHFTFSAMPFLGASIPPRG